MAFRPRSLQLASHEQQQHGEEAPKSNDEFRKMFMK